MKWLRAILTGALAWILIFFEVSILMFGFKLSAGLTYYLIHYLLLIVLVGFPAWLYFRGKKVKAGFLQGLIVGLVFMVVGLVLDLAITVPLFVKSLGFFADLMLWAGVLEGIVIVMLVGVLKKSR